MRSPRRMVPRRFTRSGTGGSHTSPCRTHPSWDHTLSMWRRIPSTIGARVASRSPSPGATTWAAPGPSSSRWW
ncbi:unnamed protein product [Durusdinium trenchii]|uniref:Uncharacterized protein n=2 Tax=Durusdinium trenchii TaxID=1381693 RepID=A0ABP0N1L5_9DINO